MYTHILQIFGITRAIILCLLIISLSYTNYKQLESNYSTRIRMDCLGIIIVILNGLLCAMERGMFVVSLIYYIRNDVVRQSTKFI